jgi:hypothetical protein
MVSPSPAVRRPQVDTTSRSGSSSSISLPVTFGDLHTRAAEREGQGPVRSRDVEPASSVVGLDLLDIHS